jgi:hypothetical protein
MKYLFTIFAVVTGIISLVSIFLFVWLLITLGGGFNVVLPGLGLVISGSLILAALLILGLIMLLLTALLLRRIYKPLR